MREVWAWWDWIKWSPVLLLVLLLVVGYLTPSDNRLQWISYIWLVIAIASTFFAILLLFKTSRIKRIAQAEAPEDDPFRILMEVQHSVTVLTFWVHTLFCSVGGMVLLLPEGHLRSTVSRALLMDGQYILLLIVALTYISVLIVTRQLRNVINEEELRNKAESTLDRNLDRRHSNGA